MLKNKFIKLVMAILLSLSAGAIGSLFTVTGVDSWYVNINKPSFNPPSWIFGPVWTTLYILMGVALYLVWKDGFKKPLVKESFNIFLIQLFFNALWSVVFFGLQSPGLALGVIMVLWIFILLTILKFYKINKIAAYLLAPYILWVSFASILNFAIFVLNL